MKQFVLIVAGGSGARMSSAVPKQFMLLSKRPVLMHTIERFVEFNANIEIVVVLPAAQMNSWEKLCLQYSFSIQHKLVSGGDVRFHSVRNGLKTIEGNGVVFIHDGVRPLVSRDTIQRCLNTTIEKGNAVPVLPVVESLRKIAGDLNQMVDRSEYVAIQTPQVFLLNEIKAAYKQDFDPLFTDDTSVFERMGNKINLVEGNRENIKITHPIDLIIAEALLLS